MNTKYFKIKDLTEFRKKIYLTCLDIQKVGGSCKQKSVCKEKKCCVLHEDLDRAKYLRKIRALLKKMRTTISKEDSICYENQQERHSFYV